MESSAVGDSDQKPLVVVEFGAVTAAAYRIKKGVKKTPLEKSLKLSEILGINIYFKEEFRQATGSFKERGARNTLELLTQEQRKVGVISASAGNHALALAYHGLLLNIPVTVVTPITAPIMKVSQCMKYKAKVLQHGQDIGESKTHAMKLAEKEGLLYVNGYDDPAIIAGQGTAALEIMDRMDEMKVPLDAVVIPVGGGGLLAGMALAIKTCQPNVKVIAVESEKCASFSAAMKAGKPVYTPAEPSLADGLAVPLVGANSLATACKHVDQVCIVDEDSIALAILRLVELQKNVIEGAGAAGLAACLSGKLTPQLAGKNVVVMLCGGNIDTTVLGRCLERGLAADGRLVRFCVRLSDRPGSLAQLSHFLASMNASVKDIVHERAMLKGSVFEVEIDCVCETRDKAHATSLYKELEASYGRGLVSWGGNKVSHAPVSPT